MGPIRIIAVTFMVLLLFTSASSHYEAEVEQEVVEALQNGQRVDVIIKFRDEKIPDHLDRRREAIQESREILLETFDQQKERRQLFFQREQEGPDLNIDSTYRLFHGVSASITMQGLETIRKHPDVEKVYIERVARIGLAQSVPLINASYGWNQISINSQSHPINGSGQAVCVIDSGTNYSHPALGGCTTLQFTAGNCPSIPAGYDYVNIDNNPMDDHGHGTHVAGIVASQDPIYQGVAPGVSLIIMKACGSSGECYSTPLLNSIDWCIDNSAAYNISVITMSLGDEGEYNKTNCPTMFNDILARARSQNITVLVASGNEYHDSGISWPACDPNAIAIGATDKSGAVSSYANVGPGLSIVAPGGTGLSAITSLALDAGFNNRFGTSMAAPHAAGAVALLYQFHAKETGNRLLPSLIETALNSSGHASYDSGTGHYYRLIDIGNALEAIREIPHIEYRSPTPEHHAHLKATSFILNITSNEPLSSAYVEWKGEDISLDGAGQTWSANLSGLGTSVYRAYGIDHQGYTGYASHQIISLNSTCLIPSDGFIISSSTILCHDNYTLSQPLLLNSSDLSIDCNGSSITGTAFSFSSHNITITGCTLQHGLCLNSSSSQNHRFERTVADNCSILFSGSSSLSLENITLINSSISISNALEANLSGMNGTHSYLAISQTNGIVLDNLTGTMNLTIMSSANVHLLRNSLGPVSLTAVSGLHMHENTLQGTDTLMVNAPFSGSISNNTFDAARYFVVLNGPDDLNLSYNYFSTPNGTAIHEKIHDNRLDPGAGTVNILPWYLDSTYTLTADADLDGYASIAFGGTDCDDSDPSINPGAEEIFDGIDNNCDGVVDEGYVTGTDISVTMINTTMINITITIDGTPNLTGRWVGVHDVVIGNGSLALISFPFNFSRNPLNVSGAFINATIINGSSALLVHGLGLGGSTKTVTLDIIASLAGFCVLDTSTPTFTDVSSDCNGTSEQLVICDGSDYDGYSCILNSGKAVISGLTHSLVLEMDGCTDKDGDGYGAGCSRGNDCDDTNASLYPGAPCERECYSGSTIDGSCQCNGGTYICQAPASGGSRGGGGGGGGAASLPSTRFTQSFYSITNGTLMSFAVDASSIPLLAIDFVSLTDAQGTTFDIHSVEEEDAPMHDGRAYAYFTIEMTGLTALANVTLHYEVNNSWQGMDEIALLRYESGWTEYPAEKMGDLSHAAHYRSIIPGFSLFAIIAKEQEIIEEDVPPVPEPVDLPSEDAEPMLEPEWETPSSTFPEENFKLYGLLKAKLKIGIGILTFLIVTYFIMAYHQGKRKHSEIERFIEGSLKQGHQDHAIHAHLVKKGIHHDHASHHISTVKEKVHHKKMEEYIEKCMELGHEELVIIETLIKHGWQESHIKEKIASIRTRIRNRHFPTIDHLESYIHERLTNGHMEEDIKKDLAKLGWEDDHAHSHVSRVKYHHDMNRLSDFIEQRLCAGDKKTGIIGYLVKHGWTSKEVDHALLLAERRLKKD